MNVLVIGASDQGRQVIDAIGEAGDHVVVGVLDDARERGTLVGGHAVVGTSVDLGACAAATAAKGFVVAIGDNTVRATVSERSLREWPSLQAVTVRHPAAIVARDALIDDGCILLAGSVVSNGCRVGRGVLLGTRASIDHDCTVEHYASLGPAATTGGNVRIGSHTAIGLGASVIHGITVGEHTVIGAGAVVVRDVGPRVVAYGVPARVARTRAPGDRYL